METIVIPCVNLITGLLVCFIEVFSLYHLHLSWSRRGDLNKNPNFIRTDRQTDGHTFYLEQIRTISPSYHAFTQGL